MVISPRSRRALTADTAHSLSDGDSERWPVIDGIPYLRAGSAHRARDAVAMLDANDTLAATALLLAENDAWWDEAPPPDATLRDIAERHEGINLRDVMRGLGWGRVGDYFAHRWSDPTFVAGLALTDAYWQAPRSGFELACGIGHHLRAWQEAGVAVTGGDVVWAKLWVARHYLLAPAATLICFDAEAPWPLQNRFDLVACHDAFYFLQDQAGVASRLRDACADAGVLLVAHIHNRDAANHSGGRGTTGSELRRLFPGAVPFDDAALTVAGARGEAPCPANWDTCGNVDAFSLAAGSGCAGPPKSAHGPLSLPVDGTRLVRNPLLTPSGIAWPSPRYRDEYGALAQYGRFEDVPDEARMSAAFAAPAARRDLLALPERW